MMLKLISTADQSAASVSSQKTSRSSALYVMPANIILAEEKQTLQAVSRISFHQCSRSGVCTYTHPKRKRAIMLSFSNNGRWSLRICPGGVLCQCPVHLPLAKSAHLHAGKIIRRTSMMRWAVTVARKNFPVSMGQLTALTE